MLWTTYKDRSETALKTYSQNCLKIKKKEIIGINTTKEATDN